MNKIKNHPNRYKLVVQRTINSGFTIPVPDDATLYAIGEQVRNAFIKVKEEIFDHVEITVNEFGCITVKVETNILSPTGVNAFDFLSKSTFHYRPQDKKPWSLMVETDDDFGIGFDVSSYSPVDCVCAMVNERRKSLEKQLTALKEQFKPFDDYTYSSHCC